MKHHVFRYHAFFYEWRRLVSGEVIALGLAIFFVVSPVAGLKLQQRGLMMDSAVAGATTNYTVSFAYTSPDAVGSIDMLFCTGPIAFLDPTSDCTPPNGLDASGATLIDQTGETGYTIGFKSSSRIILTRVPGVPLSSTPSTYKFSGIVNPSYTNEAFAIRIRTLGSTDATGPMIDFGSVRGTATNSIELVTQVPPMLMFCVAQEVELGCTETNEKYYTEMGELSDKSTLTASSQMAVGTNATGGFAITANGDYMAAGTNVLGSPTIPTASVQGTNQFGINLVENNAPTLGKNPDGVFTNAIPAPGYDTPNMYKFVSGDVVAYSPNVSLMRRFTVSYIVNSNKNLRAGVYTTTINYIASGRF